VIPAEAAGVKYRNKFIIDLGGGSVKGRGKQQKRGPLLSDPPKNYVRV
jgi:hypothetical protein